MGRRISSKKHAFPEEVTAKFEELGDLICAAGDNEFGQLFKCFRDNPDRLLTLRDSFLSLETSRPSQASLDELWLINFTSETKEKLSDTDVQDVLGIIKIWRKSEPGTDRLVAEVSQWHKDPSRFWSATPWGHTSNRELLGLYVEVYQQIEDNSKLDQIRRRIVSIAVFRAIQDEEEAIRTRGKLQKLNNAPLTYRSKAITSIAKLLWGQLPPDIYTEKRKTLARISRCGGKWSLIKPIGMLLGIRGNSKSFEQKNWSGLEIEAINKYLTTMPAYSQIAILDDALQAITGYWSQIVSPPADQDSQTSSSKITNSSETAVPDGMQSLLDVIQTDRNISDAGFTVMSGIATGSTEGMHPPEADRVNCCQTEFQNGLISSVACHMSNTHTLNQNHANETAQLEVDFYDCFDPTNQFAISDFYDFFDPSAGSLVTVQ